MFDFTVGELVYVMQAFGRGDLRPMAAQFAKCVLIPVVNEYGTVRNQPHALVRFPNGRTQARTLDAIFKTRNDCVAAIESL